MNEFDITKATTADLIHQLIRPRTYTVQVPSAAGMTTHTTHHAPLIDELESNTTTAKAGQDKYHADPRSKPAGRLDAVALLQRIDRDTDRIARTIGSRRIGTRQDKLSSLSGTAATADPPTQRMVHAKVRGWVIGAQVITGWDTSPYAPDVPCIIEDCEKRGSMRIRVEDQVAYCVECGEHWGPEQIIQLGEYVKWASEHLRGPRHWLLDTEGYPIECTVCLATREEMAARQAAKIAVTHDTDTRQSA